MGKISKYQIQEEKEKRQEEIARKNVDQYLRHRKASKLFPHELLTELHEKRIGTVDIPLSERKYWEIIPYSNKRTYEALKKIFLKTDKFYLNSDGIAAIKGILYYSNEWLKNIDDWEPKRKNPDAQYKELITFLFKKYPVPEFLDYSFVGECSEATELFMLIAKGKSFKNFPFIPDLVYMHKNKIYHHILSTPPELSYFEAFRRAQILSMGGDEELVRAFLKTRLGFGRENLKYDNFWVTVIQIFVEAGMFNYDKLGEIIDFINNQKFQISPQLGNNIPQPNMKMNGRTAETLLRQSDKWHEQIAYTARLNRRNDAEERRRFGINYKPQYDLDTKWERNRNIQAFVLTKKSKNKSTIYSVKEIITYKDLLSEGRLMSNCVGTYVGSCVNKSCSIFSFKINDENVATIEVRGNDVRQVKERGNRPISAGNAEIIKKWVNQNYLNWKA